MRLQGGWGGWGRESVWGRGWQPGLGAPCRDAGEQGGGVVGSQGAAGGRERECRLGMAGKGTAPPSVDRLRSVIRKVGGLSGFRTNHVKNWELGKDLGQSVALVILNTILCLIL